MTVKTRFAPSPTGTLHLGGARTALFNWLYARNKGGAFVLRMEDTDRERSTQESVDEILESLTWLGMDWDEGPYYQSQRDDLYKAKVEQMLKEGHAYRCYCTKEELDAKRQQMQKDGKKPMYDRTCRDLGPDEQDENKPHVIRFKNPLDGVSGFSDTLRGPVETNNSELDDLIIARTDGTPTYNFVVVVDDSEMGITHIVRGDDHIANTFKQVNIYKALGYPVPVFTHVSLILGQDKKRLSKRHGAASVLALREQGYLPDAVVNMLARLGWGYGDQEVFTRKELIEKFSLDNITMSSAVFDYSKLEWLNTQHIKAAPDDALAEAALPFAQEQFENATKEGLLKTLPLTKERSRTLAELAEGAAFYFASDFDYEEKAKTKFLDDEHKGYLEEVIALVEEKGTDDRDLLNTEFRALAEKLDTKMKEIAQPCRVALTGRTVSPGVFEMMQMLGKDETVRRLRKALDA